MLILSRKPGEALMIDGKIEVKIVEINGDKVKLGITAPDDVMILRSELRQTIESNKESAGSAVKKNLSELFKDL